MITSLESARAGVQAFERSIAIPAHHLADIRTAGFQHSRSTLQKFSTDGVATHVNLEFN